MKSHTRDLLPHPGSVIYDDECGICTWTVQMLKRMDWLRSLTFYPGHQPETYAKFPTLRPEQTALEIFVFDQRGGWYSGYDACEWIACRIPLLWIFVPLTLIPGSAPLGRHCYKWVAANRHKISRFLGMKSCKISDRP